MTLPSNGITEIIRGVMPPYRLSPDLLAVTIEALPAPPPDTSTPCRQAIANARAAKRARREARAAYRQNQAARRNAVHSEPATSPTSQPAPNLPATQPAPTPAPGIASPGYTPLQRERAATAAGLRTRSIHQPPDSPPPAPESDHPVRDAIHSEKPPTTETDPPARDAIHSEPTAQPSAKRPPTALPSAASTPAHPASRQPPANAPSPPPESDHPVRNAIHSEKPPNRQPEPPARYAIHSEPAAHPGAARPPTAPPSAPAAPARPEPHQPPVPRHAAPPADTSPGTLALRAPTPHGNRSRLASGAATQRPTPKCDRAGDCDGSA
jgi:hypothetical protein